MNILADIPLGVLLPKYWGIHVYISGTADEWMGFVEHQINDLHGHIGGTFWVTEFAEINGNIDTDKALVNFFRHTDYIARWAYFTNRSEVMPLVSGWMESGFI